MSEKNTISSQETAESNVAGCSRKSLSFNRGECGSHLGGVYNKGKHILQSISTQPMTPSARRTKSPCHQWLKAHQNLTKVTAAEDENVVVDVEAMEDDGVLRTGIKMLTKPNRHKNKYKNTNLNLQIKKTATGYAYMPSQSVADASMLPGLCKPLIEPISINKQESAEKLTKESPPATLLRTQSDQSDATNSDDLRSSRAIKFCCDLLKELHSPKYIHIAWPFYNAHNSEAAGLGVFSNPNLIPIDLHTIRTKLNDNGYMRLSEFAKDMRSIFEYSKRNFDNAHSVYFLGTQLEHVFEWLYGKMLLNLREPDQVENNNDDQDDYEHVSSVNARMKLYWLAVKFNNLRSELNELVKTLDRNTTDTIEQDSLVLKLKMEIYKLCCHNNFLRCKLMEKESKKNGPETSKNSQQEQKQQQQQSFDLNNSSNELLRSMGEIRVDPVLKSPLLESNTTNSNNIFENIFKQ